MLCSHSRFSVCLCSFSVVWLLARDPNKSLNEFKPYARQNTEVRVLSTMFNGFVRQTVHIRIAYAILHCHEHGNGALNMNEAHLQLIRHVGSGFASPNEVYSIQMPSPAALSSARGSSIDENDIDKCH